MQCATIYKMQIELIASHLPSPAAIAIGGYSNDSAISRLFVWKFEL